MSKRIASTGTLGDDLGAMIRAAGAEDAAAAASEFPYSEATLGRFVSGVRRRRAAGGAALAVVLLPVLGGAVFGVGQLWKAERITPIAPPSVSLSPSATPSASPSPSVTPSPSASPSPSPSTTTTTTTTTTAAHPAVPGRITVVSADPGGSAGAIQVHWGMVMDATGYRVYRSASPNGTFTPSASITFDGITTPTKAPTTIEIGVPYVKIKIGLYESGFLDYYEIVDGQPACFRVAAFNSVGEGRQSVVVCSNPEVSRPEPDPSTPPPPDPSTPPPPDPSTPPST